MWFLTVMVYVMSREDQSACFPGLCSNSIVESWRFGTLSSALFDSRHGLHAAVAQGAVNGEAMGAVGRRLAGWSQHGIWLPYQGFQTC